MFSREFEVIICIALAVVTGLLFFGKGDFMLKTKDDTVKKRTPEEQLKFSKGLSAFTAIWLVAELGMFFFADRGSWVVIAYLGVLILTFVGLVFYSKKNA